MYSRNLDDVIRRLPEHLQYNHFHDCQSTWLQANLMPEQVRVAGFIAFRLKPDLLKAA